MPAFDSQPLVTDNVTPYTPKVSFFEVLKAGFYNDYEEYSPFRQMALRRALETDTVGDSLSREQVKLEYGVDLPDGLESVSRRAAMGYAEHRLNRARDQRTLELSDQQGGFDLMSARLLGGFGGANADPLSFSVNLIPFGKVAGAAKLGLPGAAGKVLGNRAVQMGLEGAVGNAALAPLLFETSKQVDENYTLEDAALDTLYGAGFGSGLYLLGRGGRSLIKSLPVAQEVFSKALNKSVTDFHQGKPLDIQTKIKAELKPVLERLPSDSRVQEFIDDVGLRRQAADELADVLTDTERSILRAPLDSDTNILGTKLKEIDATKKTIREELKKDNLQESEKQALQDELDDLTELEGTLTGRTELPTTDEIVHPEGRSSNDVPTQLDEALKEQVRGKYAELQAQLRQLEINQARRTDAPVSRSKKRREAALEEAAKIDQLRTELQDMLQRNDFLSDLETSEIDVRKATTKSRSDLEAAQGKIIGKVRSRLQGLRNYINETAQAPEVAPQTRSLFMAYEEFRQQHGQVDAQQFIDEQLLDLETRLKDAEELNLLRQEDIEFAQATREMYNQLKADRKAYTDAQKAAAQCVSEKEFGHGEV